MVFSIRNCVIGMNDFYELVKEVFFRIGLRVGIDIYIYIYI